jgi:hypothetical protein
LSNTRQWGVKAHIERLQTDETKPANNEAPSNDWLQIYLDEKAAIKALSEKPRE